MSKDLKQNLQILKSLYTDCSDVIFHDFVIGEKETAALVYIDGLSNIEEIDEHLLEPLMKENADAGSITAIKDQISISSTKKINKISDVINEISNGNPVILVHNLNTGLAVALPHWEMRSIEDPAAESVVRGPREGFVETIRVNTSLIRRKIKSPQLKMKSMVIGKYTQTQIVITYIEGICNQRLLKEIENRLNKISIDGILESGYIEEMIEDNPYSPFPQVLSTERPDVVSANLLEGRAAILVDGSPFALIMPISFWSLMQSSEDYYQGFIVGTTIRWLRYFFLCVALLAPSLYVAILTYHQEMLPTTLLLTIAQSREQIPFPALVEALLMELTFEALREAGVRLPKQVGAAVSIVGALVIGQAAIQAGLASAPMVMVVAITGIASFLIPRYSMATSIRLLRFPIMFLSGFLGLTGLMLGVITLVIHLCSLRSFGVPYLDPLGPTKKSSLKDVLFRAPMWSQTTRPHFTGDDWNKNRQAPGQKPHLGKGDQ
ncbi:spore germination protein KA [Scopulibacillus daqui]|uniref:Spore germination protein KA n=1 Tax=Scopulibacillus daqui TaxID=1469162 RepID=A0ABS2PVN0_9BACL|nr:spore germination protein KA [Scopulibacillus daqui]